MNTLIDFRNLNTEISRLKKMEEILINFSKIREKTPDETLKKRLKFLVDALKYRLSLLDRISVPFYFTDFSCYLKENSFTEGEIILLSYWIFRASGITDECHDKTCISRDEKELKNHHYPYIPFDTEYFLKFFPKASRKNLKGKKFIDAGSGAGEKVFMGYLLGMDAYGIEYNKISHGMADRNTFLQNCHLINGDVFDHDFSKYDIIYSYVPISDPFLFRKFTEHILKTMKIGSYKLEVSFGSTFSLMNDKLIVLENDTRSEHPILQKVGENTFRFVRSIK